MRPNGKQTVIVRQKVYSGEVDEYGNQIYTTTDTSVNNCLVAQNATTAVINVQQFNGSTTDITIYFPQNVEINEDATFIVDDQQYSKVGKVISWVSQKGSPIKPKLVVNANLKVG